MSRKMHFCGFQCHGHVHTQINTKLAAADEPGATIGIKLDDLLTLT